jgi:hypothetical protein
MNFKKTNKPFIIILMAFISMISTTNIIFAQDREKYLDLVSEADMFYKSKEYLKSGFKFSEAFATYSNYARIDDRYNAACAWSLANQQDSAFVQLFRLVQNENFSNLNLIITDTDLDRLHSDTRWNQIIEIVKDNKEKKEAKMDKVLVAKLDSIYQEDQQYRLQTNEVEQKYGRNSNELKAHWKTINEKDSTNLIEIEKILNEKGWLGTDIVGEKGNRTLFLVIQHADLKTQEIYLPMLKEAVQKGNAAPSNLALLEDRIAMYQGKRQIYGSQTWIDNTGKQYVFPLEDPDNVDKRRAEVGLGTMSTYLSGFGMNWDIEGYKKELPELEAKHGIK